MARSALVFILVFVALAHARADMRIEVRPYAKVKGESPITLADLVVSEGMSDDISKKMQSIVIADSPRLGEQRQFTSQMLSEILRRHFGGTVKATRIPNQITVANVGHQLDADEMKQQLLSAWKAACAECRFVFRGFHLPAVPADLAGMPYRLDVRSQLPRGAFSEKLLIQKTSGGEAIFWVNGQVEVQKRVPVATRTLQQGLKLSEQDVRFEWRDTTYASDGVPDMKALFSQQVKMGIVANQIIWANSLAREKAVKRGEIVSVTTSENSWQMTLQAVTEQDGFVGDVVNVRNLQTNKVISGEVTAPGEVLVK